MQAGNVSVTGKAGIGKYGGCLARRGDRDMLMPATVAVVRTSLGLGAVKPDAAFQRQAFPLPGIATEDIPGAAIAGVRGGEGFALPDFRAEGKTAGFVPPETHALVMKMTAKEYIERERCFAAQAVRRMLAQAG